MAVELKVQWDGDAAGLAEHRFSVRALGKALAELHRGLRTAATRLELGKDPHLAPPGRGKYATRAQTLDVQIKSVEDGCVTLGMAVVMDGDQLEIAGDDLAEQSVVEFLRAVELSKPLATPYLSALGSDVTLHTYQARRADGSMLVPKFSRGRVELDEATVTPALLQLSCEVAGVTFTPGRRAVSFRASGEYGAFKAEATSAQVELAIRLHESGVPVEARVFQMGTGFRLLSLRDATTTRRIRAPEERAAHIMTKWHGVLRRLAQ